MTAKWFKSLGNAIAWIWRRWSAKASWLGLVFLAIGAYLGFLAVVQTLKLNTRHLEHWEWGTAAACFAAVGTVGTLAWGVGQGLYLMAQANREKRLAQARQISGWTTPLPPSIPRADIFPPAFGPCQNAQSVHLANSSAEAVYEVVVHIVWIQGAAPRTGEEIEAHYRNPRPGEPPDRMRAVVQVLPPNTYWLPLAGPTSMVPAGRLGLEVAFTDGAGRHWIRRVPTGNLEQLDTPPVEHYGIGRPLGYSEVKPWSA
ncbi:hypothetical protein [Mycobacterium sp. 852002-50816_SCH5313054-b]|uniref:hypothetical protein n=1 Tax=Mycobacterium sp. 852002-50816_SCH5313054-b TaxID=1834092 RepID=UPI000A428608|nr:hypothetical protein [Mycobacterium sp. 852002-50816_SCH5313054-b]